MSRSLSGPQAIRENYRLYAGRMENRNKHTHDLLRKLTGDRWQIIAAISHWSYIIIWLSFEMSLVFGNTYVEFSKKSFTAMLL